MYFPNGLSVGDLSHVKVLHVIAPSYLNTTTWHSAPNYPAISVEVMLLLHLLCMCNTFTSSLHV